MRLTSQIICHEALTILCQILPEAKGRPLTDLKACKQFLVDVVFRESALDLTLEEFSQKVIRPCVEVLVSRIGTNPDFVSDSLASADNFYMPSAEAKLRDITMRFVATDNRPGNDIAQEQNLGPHWIEILGRFDVRVHS